MLEIKCYFLEIFFFTQNRILENGLPGILRTKETHLLNLNMVPFQERSYHFGQIVLHWFIAILVLYQFVSSNTFSGIKLSECQGTEVILVKCQSLNNHYVVGSLILVLMVLRVGMRIYFGAPMLSSKIPLYIKVLGKVTEPNVVKENKKIEPKTVAKRAKPKANTLYSKMVEIYDNFCFHHTGVGSKMDGMQGKAMKSIIVFLKKQCVKKTPDLSNEDLDKNVILSWEYILKSWDKLDNYNRNRIKLSDINSSMSNILMKLKEQPISKKQKQRYEQINKAVRGASNTDYSGLGS